MKKYTREEEYKILNDMKKRDYKIKKNYQIDVIFFA